MPEEKPILDPSRELPSPHDMQLNPAEKHEQLSAAATDGQLPMTHYQNLPKPAVIHSHSWLKWVMIVALILVGLSGAGLVYLQNTTTPTTPPELVIPPKSTPDVDDDETTDWITYADPQNRFKFKYPKSWTQSNKEARPDGSWERIDIQPVNNPNEFIRPDIAVIITKDTAESIGADIIEQGGTFEEDESYGVLSGKLYEATNSATTHSTQHRLDFVVASNGATYWFRLFTTPEEIDEHEELFEDILSTFAFTDTGANIPQPRPSGEYPAVVEIAKEDLTKKLKIKKSDITVDSVNDAQWSDGSLGCPKPGMVYTQAIVPGHKIVLRAVNNSYIYHTNTSSLVVQCDNAILLLTFSYIS